MLVKFFIMKFYLLNIFFLLEVNAKEFCEIDILDNIYNKNCPSDYLLFGYLNFNSENSNLEYIFDRKYNVDIPLFFNTKIRDFLDNNCQIKKDVRIKQITNLSNDGNKKFKNQIIISCKKK